MSRIIYLTLAAMLFVTGCMSNGPMSGSSASESSEATGMSNDGPSGGGVEEDAEAGEIAEPTTGL